MFDDAAQFDRQRRNVIVAGSVLWALTIAGIHVDAFLPVRAQPTSPCNLYLLWGIVLGYFLWRLYQVSHDIRAQRRTQFLSSLKTEITKRLFKSFETKELKNKIIQEYASRGLTIESVTFDGSTIQLTGDESEYVYKVKTTITYTKEVERTIGGNTQEVVIRKGGDTWRRAAVINFITLSLKTTYFTEFLLPILIGVSAALIALIGYSVCLVNSCT
jgi:hypothetical protein